MGAETCTGTWPPGVPGEGQLPVTCANSRLAGCHSASSQHLHLVPCLEAESQQESTERVPHPHILAGTRLGCGIQRLRKWLSVGPHALHPLSPSPTPAGEPRRCVQPLALLIPLNTHCARRAGAPGNPDPQPPPVCPRRPVLSKLGFRETRAGPRAYGRTWPRSSTPAPSPLTSLQ